MPRSKAYRRRIQTKLPLMLGLLVLISLASFGLLSYFVTRSTLEKQTGDGLVSHAEMIAAVLSADPLANWLSEMMVPGRSVYSLLQERLSAAKTRKGNLDNIILIGKGDRVLADANGELPVGEEYAILRAEASELKSAWNGSAKASLLYRGKDGRLYKSAYAPVITKDQKVVAVVRVEAGADFLNTANRVGLALLISAFVIIVIVVLLGVLMARSIVVPIRELARASQRIASGDLNTTVSIDSKDEIGLFAQTFNQMAKDLKKLYDEVAEHGRQIVELSASVAHEVRSPINAIQGFAELLEDELEEGDPRLEYIAGIKEEIEILNSKVTDFIHFARPLVIEPNPLDIVEVLETALLSMDKETADNNINVIKNFPSDLPVVIGDFEQLRAMFINLIRNAVQAMNKGGELIININRGDGSAQSEGIDPSFIEVTIEDNGCGMSPEAVRRAFEPFFTTKGNGTGLGLSIVKKIVSAHNGHIKLESTPGVGTRARVFLPAGGSKIYPLDNVH